MLSVGTRLMSVIVLALRWFCLAFVLFLLAPAPADSQITLSGAILFASYANGTAINRAQWATLPGGPDWVLWFALEPDYSEPVNGPTDAGAAISIPLIPGNTYQYYTCGAADHEFNYSALNLFFNGNADTPGIS